jgi:hypothetical protein
MPIDGTYEITITTPMGTRTHTLILETNNNTLNGTLIGPFGKQNISDGAINGNGISWSVELKPLRGSKAYLLRGFRSTMHGIMGNFAGPPIMGPPTADMRLFFTGFVQGDDISGHVEMGPISSVVFRGTRIKNPA